MNVGIIILAAGASSRMGLPKQLMLIEGKTMIKRIIDNTLETPCYPIVAVLGANADLLKQELIKVPITIIDNPNWQQGMASSMKMGLVGAYMTQKEIDAVIFLTSDMPMVSDKLLKDMIQKAEESADISIVACQYLKNNERIIGIPVLFKRHLFNEILELKGDEGAKKVVLKHQKNTALLAFPEGYIDLDTMEEYKNFIATFNQN